MSHRMLPLLYLNLGGEMMYIIDQRLMAQKITVDKSSKVLNDIASTMFNKKFIHEIFLKHTPLYSRKVLRAMFDRLAHASIMRLNAGSMDKLYDLMIMAVKHQILMSQNPRHLIMVTLNHLDAMTDYATSPTTKKNIYTTYELLIQTYCGLSVSQLQWIRYAILNFFQDLRVRVSFFLQNETQHQDGTFIYGPITKLPRGVEKPGTIRFFDAKGEIMDKCDFLLGVEYEEADFEGGLGIHETGNRGTKHGLNMYENSKSAETEEDRPTNFKTSSHRYALQQDESDGQEKDDGEGDQIFSPRKINARATASATKPSSNYTHFDPSCKLSLETESRSGHLAKEELNLLAKLIGATETQNQETFRINLFDPVFDEQEQTRPNEQLLESDVVQIDLRSDRCSRTGEISRIIGELDLDGVKSNEEDEDLLALMDKAT